MRNPYFTGERESAFSAAAAAVDEYLRDNADKKEIPDSEISKLPQVAIMGVAGKIPPGYLSELHKRVKSSHAETEEVKAMARKELGVTDFVNKFSLTELKTL